MKKFLFMIVMAIWGSVSVWLQFKYIKPGMEFGEWCLVSICIMSFYITLFIAHFRMWKRKNKVRNDNH